MLGFFSLPPEAGPEVMLADLAAALAAEGLSVAGAVQVNSGPGTRCTCDMDMLVLGESGPPVRITQSLGTGAGSCRLDAGALEAAAARVEARLAAGADLLILAKFGKQEAAGRGFRDALVQALGAGVPVLLHVSPDLRAPFAEFAGDLAEELPPGDLARWCRAAAGRAM